MTIFVSQRLVWFWGGNKCEATGRLQGKTKASNTGRVSLAKESKRLEKQYINCHLLSPDRISCDGCCGCCCSGWLLSIVCCCLLILLIFWLWVVYFDGVCLDCFHSACLLVVLPRCNATKTLPSLQTNMTIAGTSTMNEDVFPYWKFGTFQCHVVSFQRGTILRGGEEGVVRRRSFSLLGFRCW